MANHTCAAYLPCSVVKCPEPVAGRRGKRFCSRRCQNRDYKERWRGENRIADMSIRLRERRKRRLVANEREREAMRAYVGAFAVKHPGEEAFVQSILAAYGLKN